MSNNNRTILTLGNRKSSVVKQQKIAEEKQEASASYLSKRTGFKPTAPKTKAEIVRKEAMNEVPVLNMTDEEVREWMVTKLKYASNMIDGTDYEDYTARHIWFTFRTGIIYSEESPKLAFDANGIFKSIDALFKKKKYAKLFRKIRQKYEELNVIHNLEMPELKK